MISDHQRVAKCNFGPLHGYGWIVTDGRMTKLYTPDRRTVEILTGCSRSEHLIGEASASAKSKYANAWASIRAHTADVSHGTANL